jgi:CheY-like chemotaxis protein
MHSYQDQPTHAKPLQPLQGLHILLVEDELDVADLLVFVFQTAGATIRWCSSAETALSVLESFPPDILVSNIKLPLHDGTWLIQQIRCHPRSELQHMPALAVTSYDREVSANLALGSGFDLFLSKLDSPEALVDAISALVVNPKDWDH